MNKKFLAVAVAGAMAAPMAVSAQSEVTVYAQVHQGLTHFNFDEADSTEQITDRGRNRFGINARQDIGAGMHAFGRLEEKVDFSGTGGGDSIFNGRRQSHVGFGGDWGSLAVGTFHGTNKQYGGTAWDPMVTTDLEQRRAGGQAGGAFGTNDFVTNAIEYRSPSINGFSFSAQTGFNDVDDRDASSLIQGDFSVGASYEMDDFEFIAAVTVLDEEFEVNENDDDTNFKLGVKWDSGPLSVWYVYEDVGILGSTGGAAQIDHAMGFGMHANFDDSHAHHFLGTTYTVGQNTFYGGLGHTDADGDDQDVTNITAAIIHRPTGQFRLYAGIQYQDFDMDVHESTMKLSAGARYDFSGTF